LIPVKFFGGLLAIGAGMALGREGPSVQMGAVVADLVGKAGRRAWPGLRTLVAAGAGAGLAVAFNAPIAGAFEALRLLEQAITIDMHYGPALAWAAVAQLRLVADGWTDAPETSRCKGIALARQSLVVGENDPQILANAAFVLAWFGEDIDAMIGLVDRALTINPSFAHGWYLSGLLKAWAGQPDLAIAHVETSLRLSPRDHTGQPLFVLGAAYFFKHRFEEAVPKLLLSIQDHPGYPNDYRFLAASYAHLRRLDEACATVARLR
jgi:adenylate cyclase